MSVRFWPRLLQVCLAVSLLAHIAPAQTKVVVISLQRAVL